MRLIINAVMVITGFSDEQQHNAITGAGTDGTDADNEQNNDADADAAELLRQLHEHITQDEEIAVKSAILLKLLEVSLPKITYIIK